jgi:hypothetical protein
MTDSYFDDELRKSGLAVAPYRGACATRGMLPDSVSSAGVPQQMMARSLHYARFPMTAPRPAFAIGWYVNTSNAEVVQAGSYQIRASIEYPLGVFTQLTFGGGATGTYTGGDVAIADAPAVTIPDNALFAVRFWVNSPAGWIYTNGYSRLPGEASNVGATVADQTMSGTVTNGTSVGIGIMPLAILDMTTQRSFLLIGDSITAGNQTDTADVTGDFGTLARIVGATRGYANFGRPSVTAAQFTATSAARRIAFSQYFSDVVSGLGRNDGGTAASIIASLQANRALFPNLPFYQATIPPTSTGAWTALDASDQVAGGPGAGATVVAVNQEIRRGLPTSSGTILPTITGYVDVRAVAELSPDSYLWTPRITGDGIHPNAFGYRRIAATAPGRDLLLG